MSSRHPANRGKSLLSAWVDSPLRDYVREAARSAGVPVSEWIAGVLQRAVASESLERLRVEIDLRQAECPRCAARHKGACA